ncbi:MAG: response regulator transcription factor [Pirellulaceae bacterium]
MYSMPQYPAVILVIDDDPLILTGVAATLDMAGYECHCARDPEAARKAARAESLDLIICDVNLNGISGLELCNELRKETHAQDVPVLFVSSHQAPDIIRRAHDAGGAYYLRKPFDPDVLVELVGKALWMPHLVRSRIDRVEPARPLRNAAFDRARQEASIRPAGRPLDVNHDAL